MAKPKNVLDLYNNYKEGMERFKKREEKLLSNKQNNSKKLEKLETEKLKFQKEFANLFIRERKKDE